jgi:hypothetical protein
LQNWLVFKKNVFLRKMLNPENFTFVSEKG